MNAMGESLQRGTPTNPKAQESFSKVNECELLGGAQARSRYLLVPVWVSYGCRNKLPET